jgi:DNA sulfur modification protein DndD
LKPAVEALEARANQLKIEIVRSEDRQKELDQALEGSDSATIRRIQRELTDVIEKMSVTDQSIKETKDLITECEDQIRKLRDKLARGGGANIVAAQNATAYYRSLHSLFEEGVEFYREDLRKHVEKSASELFLKLTTEPDYAGLTINEHYGLTIQHRNGRAIPVRSAGAEHVVALSLMGALQRNAPLRGPIVMDSPFGRLDDRHKERIIRALPNLAEQVLLLVHESEVRPEQIRELLGPKLLAEYEIQRVSARHSQLIER